MIKVATWRQFNITFNTGRDVVTKRYERFGEINKMLNELLFVANICDKNTGKTYGIYIIRLMQWSSIFKLIYRIR